MHHQSQHLSKDVNVIQTAIRTPSFSTSPNGMSNRPPFSSHLFRKNKNSHELMLSKTNNEVVLSSLCAAAYIALCSSIISFPISNANAVTFDSTVLNGDYSDPFHPYCERHIEVSSDQKTFHYSGTAVGLKSDPDVIGRGCSPEEQAKYGLRKGAFDGDIIFNGKGISAGDGIHEGVWEDSTVSGDSEKLTGIGVDGIRWNDGNKWVKLSSSNSRSTPTSTSITSSTMVADDSSTLSNEKEMKSVGKTAGEYIFVAYTVFSLLAGAKEFYTRFQKRME